MNTPDNDLEILDAIYHEAALVDAEHGGSTPDDQRWARDVRSKVAARLAEMRRSLTPAAAPPKKARPIRPSLLALGRDALVARLTELTQRMGGAVQFAHRNLVGLSDDDLRRLIDTLDPSSEDAAPLDVSSADAAPHDVSSADQAPLDASSDAAPASRPSGE